MRRRLALLLVATSLAGGIALAGTPSASAGGCPSGEVEVRGRIRDASTGLFLDETTSVSWTPAGSGTPADDLGTENGRWSTCLLPDTYQFAFLADSYRLDAAASTEVVVSEPGPVTVLTNLTPRGKVLVGRVTNLGGVPKFASVTIWRRSATGVWRAYDNIGNNQANGIWKFRVPGPGRYRINAAVDSHWARWYDGDTRLRHARVVNVVADTTYINGLDIRVPYCHAAPDFCIPPGFLT